MSMSNTATPCLFFRPTTMVSRAVGCGNVLKGTAARAAD
jgi:hypothetical protein